MLTLLTGAYVCAPASPYTCAPVGRRGDGRQSTDAAGVETTTERRECLCSGGLRTAWSELTLSFLVITDKSKRTFYTSKRKAPRVIYIALVLTENLRPTHQKQVGEQSNGSCLAVMNLPVPGVCTVCNFGHIVHLQMLHTDVSTQVRLWPFPCSE